MVEDRIEDEEKELIQASEDRDRELIEQAGSDIDTEKGYIVYDKDFYTSVEKSFRNCTAWVQVRNLIQSYESVLLSKPQQVNKLINQMKDVSERLRNNTPVGDSALAGGDTGVTHTAYWAWVLASMQHQSPYIRGLLKGYWDNHSNLVLAKADKRQYSPKLGIRVRQQGKFLLLEQAGKKNLIEAYYEGIYVGYIDMETLSADWISPGLDSKVKNGIVRLLKSAMIDDEDSLKMITTEHRADNDGWVEE